VPTGVVDVVVMFNVELPEPIEAGLKEHAAPAGRPAEQARLTAALNPFAGVMETVVATEEPAATVTGDVTEIENSTAVATVRLTDALWLNDPEVPVIVTL
jgi:hypothetical protein